MACNDVWDLSIPLTQEIYKFWPLKQVQGKIPLLVYKFKSVGRASEADELKLNIQTGRTISCS